MYRCLLTVVLGACVVGLAAAQDTVFYYDQVTKKDNAQLVGVIEGEDARGIKIKVKDGKNMVVKEIRSGDIREIHFKVAEVSPLDYRRPFGREFLARKETGKRRTKLLEEALEGYTKLEEQCRGNPMARRYIQYKVADVTAQLAQDDSTKVDAAIKLLSEFKSANPTSWTIVPALKTLAKLQEEAGKTADAAKTYEELADLPGVPKDLKQESEILVGRLLLRGGKYADAQKRLEKLAASMSAEDAQKPFVDAFLAESKIGQDKLAGVDRALQGVIRSSSDGRLRSVAYTLLGDYYRKKGDKENAFWAYLRVDALYHDDPEAQAKALWYLSSLFDEVKKDPVRGKECLRRLRDKRFAGTAFQKLAPAEEKTETEPKKKEPAKKKG